jgi:hypothetical protein
LGDATQRTFPDVALRWTGRSDSPTATIKSITATARVLGITQLLASPDESAVRSMGSGVTRSWNYPLTVSTVWAGERPITTTLGANYSSRLDDRPGLAGRGRNLDVSADVSKAFALPKDWGARSDVRTRLTYQNSYGQSYVLNPLAIDARSQLNDNGRRAVTFTADTDVAENLSSSVVVSRVASYDRNFNRRFTQTVLSAVLHMQFFAGAMK